MPKNDRGSILGGGFLEDLLLDIFALRSPDVRAPPQLFGGQGIAGQVSQDGGRASTPQVGSRVFREKVVSVRLLSHVVQWRPRLAAPVRRAQLQCTAYCAPAQPVISGGGMELR